MKMDQDPATTPEWVEYTEALWNNQRLPDERKLVLLRLRVADPTMRLYLVAVGYMKLGAGEADSPYFVRPSACGEVVAWCDCLPDWIQARGACWPIPEVSP